MPCSSVGGCQGFAVPTSSACINPERGGSVWGRSLLPIHYLHSDLQTFTSYRHATRQCHINISNMVEILSYKTQRSALHWQDGVCFCPSLDLTYRIYANLMRTSIFKTLKPEKVFAGECNAHRQKVHSLQQCVFIMNSILQKKNTILW
jgi:hypothetical protein